jgi:hypothetical protein
VRERAGIVGGGSMIETGLINRSANVAKVLRRFRRSTTPTSAVSGQTKPSHPNACGNAVAAKGLSTSKPE